MLWVQGTQENLKFVLHRNNEPTNQETPTPQSQKHQQGKNGG